MRRLLRVAPCGTMNDLPAYLILPLLLGLLHSVAAMTCKRAMAEDMDIWRIIFFSNLATSILLFPLLSFADTPPSRCLFLSTAPQASTRLKIKTAAMTTKTMVSAAADHRRTVCTYIPPVKSELVDMRRI